LSSWTLLSISAPFVPVAVTVITACPAGVKPVFHERHDGDGHLA